jgi:hypothetical protein
MISLRGFIMDMIHCAFCGKEVKLVHFGNGWVGICCNKIAYNNIELPVRYQQTDIPVTSNLIEEFSENFSITYRE